jgi:hypothetical protein
MTFPRAVPPVHGGFFSLHTQANFFQDPQFLWSRSFGFLRRPSASFQPPCRFFSAPEDFALASSLQDLPMHCYRLVFSAVIHKQRTRYTLNYVEIIIISCSSSSGSSSSSMSRDPFCDYSAEVECELEDALSLLSCCKETLEAKV